MTTHPSKISRSELNRREFLQFMGRASLTAVTLSSTHWLMACATSQNKMATSLFTPLGVNDKDTLSLAEGFKYHILLKHEDVINTQNEKFGYDNDFIAFIPNESGDAGYLWVNHEDADPVFIHGYEAGKTRGRDQILQEQKNVGGSLVWIKKENQTWVVDTTHKDSRRYDGQTKIPFAWKEPIYGADHAIGTIANCSGGVTPWKTFLTCEENYQNNYGEVSFYKNKRVHTRAYNDKHGWSIEFDYPPEHYGWVVEVNPRTHEAKKLVSLGRFAHEAAKTVVAKDGRVVVYSGDDKPGECIYKFISHRKDSLETGTLFVADTINGKWLPLDLNLNPKLKSSFKSQTEILIHTRLAAKLAGGTPHDRPEGMDVDPKTGALICALTYNKERGNLYGSLIKIEEAGNDPLSMDFKFSTFLTGGPEIGFACPDNVIFDRNGNIWFTTDISDPDQNKGAYAELGNNSLCYVPMSGPDAGRVLRVATGPKYSELAGPCFANDGKTLFLSVQHPGSTSISRNNALSHWPGGGNSTPKPAVVAITGPTLERLLR